MPKSELAVASANTGPKEVKARDTATPLVNVGSKPVERKGDKKGGGRGGMRREDDVKDLRCVQMRRKDDEKDLSRHSLSAASRSLTSLNMQVVAHRLARQGMGK